MRVHAMVLFAVWPGAAWAQAPPAAPIRVTIEAEGRARSAPLSLREGDMLIVRPLAGPAGTPAVDSYIYNAKNELVATDDPEGEVRPDYRWTARAGGDYYVVLRNASAVRGEVEVRVQRRTETTGSRGEDKDKSYAVVRVHYATNRTRNGGAPATYFGTEAAPMTYGTCDVSIPRDHRMGELEEPSVFRLEWREDPERHVVLLKVSEAKRTQFFEQVGERVRRSERKEALVFVHGFNVTFADAARRTAQLTYDLGFDGAPVLFSWPSQGQLSVVDYRKDERNNDLSVDAFRELLEDVSRSTGAKAVHVIAHSMGNRLLAKALEQLAAKGGTTPLGQVALMAPDIDAELFRRAAPRLAPAAARVTLYASKEDIALQASQKFAGYPRAGQAGDGILVTPGIETVDASAVKTSFWGVLHQFYADNTTVLSDLFHLIRGRSTGERFGLEAVQGKGGRYWRFRPAVR